MARPAVVPPAGRGWVIRGAPLPGRWGKGGWGAFEESAEDVSTVPKPVESCRFENHDIAVFLGDVFFRIERQRFFLLQVFFPVISTGVI